MWNVVDYIAKKMEEYKIKNYDTDTVLLEVPAASSKDVGQSGQFVFLASFSTDDGKAMGKMVSADNGVELTPSVINTQVFKYQKFKGATTVRNITSGAEANTLYVEAVIVTPIACRKGSEKA